MLLTVGQFITSFEVIWSRVTSHIVWIILWSTLHLFKLPYKNYGNFWFWSPKIYDIPKRWPILLNFLLIMLLSSVQKLYLLCSILFPQLLYNYATVHIQFSGSRLSCFNFYLLCQNAVLLLLIYYAQCYAHEKIYILFVLSCGLITSSQKFMKTNLKSFLLC